jgi:hypothetical protein
VIRRLGMLALATAFSRWLQRWERQQRIVATLHSALGRLINRLITSVWNAWVDLVLGRRRLRGLLGRMQSSSQENRRLQAFRHFCAVVSQAVAERQQHEAYLAQHAEALVQANRRLARRRMLWLVVGEWRTGLIARSSKRRVAKRAANAMLKRSLSGAFATWANFALSSTHDLEICRLKDQLAYLFSRDRRRACCVDVFKAWLLFIEERWEERDYATRNLDHVALEMAIKTETESGASSRRIPLRY